MKFFENIKNSIYSPDYYKEVAIKPISYSFKYFFLFALLVSVIVAGIMCFSASPDIKSFILTSIEQLNNYYPEKLEVNIKNGIASSNVQEPYFLKIPDEFKNKDIDNVLVIDTKNKFSLDNFNSYRTTILLNSDSIAYMGDKKVEMMLLKDYPDVTINKAEVNSLFDAVKPFVKFVYPAVFILVFLFQFIVITNKLIYLIFAALLVWLIFKIRKIDIGYKKSYQLGMHLMTLGIILGGLFFIFHITAFPYFFTILLILLSLINIKKS